MSRTDGCLSEIFIGSLSVSGSKRVTDTLAAIKGNLQTNQMWKAKSTA